MHDGLTRNGGPPRNQGFDKLRVTAAICTWNRCQSLQQTLDGFTRLNVPDDMDWELLVVNNNCTDGTDDVIRAIRRPVANPARIRTHARSVERA